MQRLDVGLNPQNLPRERIPEQVSAIAVVAEEAGLHSVWVGRKDPVPVWIDGNSPTALLTAVEHCNAVLVPTATPEAVAEVRAMLREL